MRNRSRLATWLKARWLEVVLLVGLAGLLAWYANMGLGFVPKPTPTPLPAPTRTPVPTRPVRTWTPVPTRLPPTATPTPLPAVEAPTTPTGRAGGQVFDGPAAYQHVLAQARIGPRSTGSEGSRRTQEYIDQKLRASGWQVENQDFTYKDTPARNVIARAGAGPVIIIGAHYDTRLQADNDPDPAKRTQSVPGANDGASGVAVLLELARTLDKSKLTNEVWLIFFDAEDNGRLNNWDFIAGSSYLAKHLTAKPQAVVVVDMIGDADQQIFKERNSTAALQDQVWRIANALGYQDYFRPDFKHTMVDDHTPFLEQGIPALDIIDFDYPYWHTMQDTADKVSPASLERVGRVLQTYLERPTQEEK
jgi:glutaminyl-peptide cyclotransferase